MDPLTGNERFITKPQENQSMTEIQTISTERIEKKIKNNKNMYRELRERVQGPRGTVG